MQEKLPRELKKIAVLRALNLGDLLCVIPAIRALRAHYPKTDITLIGLPEMADTARRFSRYFNSFSSFPGMPGLPEQSFDLDSFSDFLYEENRQKYDLVLQLHGNGSVTNVMACMLDSRSVAGYFQEGAFCPNTKTFMQYPEGLAEVRRHVRLMVFLGIPSRGEFLEFPIAADERKAMNALAEQTGLDEQKYVCIHPGARDARRRWAPSKFAQIADSLVERGYTVVFTGTRPEVDSVNCAREEMKYPSISLVGKTDLGMLGALLVNAKLLVSNDTGISHIAAALGTPSVVIFLTSDPARWAPLDRRRHQIVMPGQSDVRDVMRHMDIALEMYPVLSKQCSPSAFGSTQRI